MKLLTVMEAIPTIIHQAAIFNNTLNYIPLCTLEMAQEVSRKILSAWLICLQLLQRYYP
jgi:hypothetical protein